MKRAGWQTSLNCWTDTDIQLADAQGGMRIPTLIKI